MISRLRFATRPADLGAEGWAQALHHDAQPVLAAPREAAPHLVTVDVVLTPSDGRPPRHDGLVREWFVDEAHLHRFEAWTAERSAPSGPDGPLVVADAEVRRGADWLEGRWDETGPRLKHVALAVRVPGLTPDAFSARWRSHAGAARRADGTVAVIPDEARGCAYVQHHPRLGDGPPPPYDAITEVYVDDEAGLRRRVAWFDDNGIGRTPDDLFAATWFLAVREEPVTLSPR